jgi:class 3 adenylate cyclase
VAQVVEAHRGAALERTGDNVLMVFPNASDAIRAVAAIRDALAGGQWPPLRITVHSGRWSGDPTQPVAGTALSRLMRLARVPKPGQVLVSQTTAALVEGDRSLPALCDAGERKVSDFDEPIRVYELVLPETNA